MLVWDDILTCAHVLNMPLSMSFWGGSKGVRANTMVDVRVAGYLYNYTYPYRYLGGIQIPAQHGEEPHGGWMEVIDKKLITNSNDLTPSLE